MKQILTILLAAFSITAGAQTFATITATPPDVTVVQINAKWNKSNTRTDLNNLRGCQYVFGWLEDQPAALKESIISVPVVVIYKDGVPAQQYIADISLKLQTPLEEIQRRVAELRE